MHANNLRAIGNRHSHRRRCAHQTIFDRRIVENFANRRFTARRTSQTLRIAVRDKMGRGKHAHSDVLDSQSVKTPAMPAERGFDYDKRVKGRKRHVLSDALGLLLEVLVTPASISEGAGAKKLLQRAGRRRGPIKQVRYVWVDAGRCRLQAV